MKQGVEQEESEDASDVDSVGYTDVERWSRKQKKIVCVCVCDKERQGRGVTERERVRESMCTHKQINSEQVKLIY